MHHSFFRTLSTFSVKMDTNLFYNFVATEWAVTSNETGSSSERLALSATDEEENKPFAKTSQLVKKGSLKNNFLWVTSFTGLMSAINNYRYHSFANFRFSREDHSKMFG